MGIRSEIQREIKEVEQREGREEEDEGEKRVEVEREREHSTKFKEICRDPEVVERCRKGRAVRRRRWTWRHREAKLNEKEGMLVGSAS